MNTYQLKPGYIVRDHGNAFLLTTRHTYVDEGSTVVRFDTELLEFCPGVMPKHWADEWKIQGNQYATWHVVGQALRMAP